jgi:hypothetical protein
MSFRVDDEVLKLSGSELTRSSRIRFMRWVLLSGLPEDQSAALWLTHGVEHSALQAGAIMLQAKRMWNFTKIRAGGWLWALRFRPKRPQLDRMDRLLKLQQLKRSLYLLDETMVAPCVRSSQLKRASALSAEGQSSKTVLLRRANVLESMKPARP